MAQIPTIQEMLEAGVHFGHQTRRWNPRMKPYILTARNGIYVIDLEKTLECLQRAVEKILRVRATGASVLFVGTKPTIQGAVREEASRVGMPYVTTRWLGGMLTNYQTIRTRVRRMEEIEGMIESGVMATLPKKEQAGLKKELVKLQAALGGIRDMQDLPAAIFVVDTKHEENAIKEAARLHIPVIGLIDTNADPDEVDFGIPANDDAIRSVNLLCTVAADAIIAGSGAEVTEAEMSAEAPAEEAATEEAAE